MATLPDTFCVFILTHGRPDNVITMQTLDRCGYTGKRFLIVDNEDATVERYRENFGAERVIVFDKKAEADACDEGNNFDERRTITMARNACFWIAKGLGIKHFLELDDDYINVRYRFSDAIGDTFDVKNLDRLIKATLCFYLDSGALSVAFSQIGDFIGGIDNGVRAYRFSKRKCMNSFFCSTDRPFRFVGAMNEDVNTYMSLGSRGRVFLTIPVVAINQKATQSQAGGITDMYKKFGTYCKAFTTLMMSPSAASVSMMRTSRPRIHHSINWPKAVPCIVSERHRR